jgi:hypothetical protein
MSKIISMLEKLCKRNFGKLTILSSLAFNSNNVVLNLCTLILVLSMLNKKNLSLIKNNLLGKNNYNFENEVKENIKKEIVNGNSDITKENNIESNIEKNNKIKNNIKIICKKNDKVNKLDKDPYKNDLHILEQNYKNEIDKTDFKINVNNTICSTPIFNLRTYKDLNYYYNFIIHDFDPKKINNLIMCQDIHKWMSTSTLSNDDLCDELAPLYFIQKINNKTEVYEYLKLFINTDNNGTKIAFVQKGVDYLVIKDDIDELINKGLIKDLLSDKHYTNYNLSINEGISDFLEKFLSLVLIAESCIGEQIELDIGNYFENKKTMDYYYNTVNSDSSLFNTSI